MQAVSTKPAHLISERSLLSTIEQLKSENRENIMKQSDPFMAIELLTRKINTALESKCHKTRKIHFKTRKQVWYNDELKEMHDEMIVLLKIWQKSKLKNSKEEPNTHIR